MVGILDDLKNEDCPIKKDNLKIEDNLWFDPPNKDDIENLDYFNIEDRLKNKHRSDEEWSQNEDTLKNEDYLIDLDHLKNEDDPKTLDDLKDNTRKWRQHKNRDNIENEDDGRLVLLFMLSFIRLSQRVGGYVVLQNFCS